MKHLTIMLTCIMLFLCSISTVCYGWDILGDDEEIISIDLIAIVFVAVVVIAVLVYAGGKWLFSEEF